MLRIAISPTSIGRWLGSRARAVLAEHRIEALLLPWEGPLDRALLHGEADLAVSWLSDWPPAQGDEAVVVTAVAPRMHPWDVLIARPQAEARHRDFFLQEGAVVMTGTPLQRAQLAAFRSDFRWLSAPTAVEEGLAHLRSGAADALVVAEAHLIAVGADLDGLLRISLHPSECTPSPGQGVLAYLSRRDDRPIRHLLRSVHHKEVSTCTNIERSLLRAVRQQHPSLGLCAFAERDAQQRFHLFVAAAFPDGTVRRLNLSHSTHLELTEQALRQLAVEKESYSRTRR